MKNLKHTFNSLALAVVVLSIFIPASGYAEIITKKTVILNCAPKPSQPTIYQEPGIPDTTITSVEVDGMKVDGVKINGEDVLITMQTSEHGNTDHVWPIVQSILPDAVSKKDRVAIKPLLQKLQVSAFIYARCSSYLDSGLYTIWGPGIARRAMPACPKGDGAIIELGKPYCDERPDQHAVITITKAKEESTDQLNATEAYDDELGIKIDDAFGSLGDISPSIAVGGIGSHHGGSF